MAAYTEALSAEMRKFNVAVSILEPGNFRSDIMRNMEKRLTNEDAPGLDSQFESEISRMAGFTRPDRSRHADPAPVADAVVDFLTSNQPKLRYMVTPNADEAEMTVRRALQRAVELNQGQAYTLRREELVALLDRLLGAEASP